MLAPTDLAYYSGEDALNLPLLALGAVGVVSVVSHVVRRALRRDGPRGRRRRLDEAAPHQRACCRRCDGIMTRTQGAIMAKAALQLLGVLATGRLPPLVDATDDRLELLPRRTSRRQRLPP